MLIEFTLPCWVCIEWHRFASLSLGLHLTAFRSSLQCLLTPWGDGLPSALSPQAALGASFLLSLLCSASSLPAFGRAFVSIVCSLFAKKHH